MTLVGIMGTIWLHLSDFQQEEFIKQGELTIKDILINLLRFSKNFFHMVMYFLSWPAVTVYDILSIIIWNEINGA